jgi:hypothetical protein
MKRAEHPNQSPPTAKQSNTTHKEGQIKIEEVKMSSTA